MYSFRNDYSEGAHPKVLEALAAINTEQNTGYGLDEYSEIASVLIKERIGRKDVDVHFLTGGTQANLTVISAALRTHEAVIAAETGHINVHETGAIEATGHKVIAMKAKDGKLTPELIKKAVALHTDEHMVKPALVYISNSTEVGTCYTKEELAELRRTCREYGLLLFMDGARLGSALTAEGNNLALPDIAAFTDVFYIGGTKNGALMGEAVVLCNPVLKREFRYVIKQKGGMLAKGFLIGVQFKRLFEDGLYFEMACHANRMAAILKEALSACGYSFWTESKTNQLFPVLPDTVLEKLATEFDYTFMHQEPDGHSCIRLVTSWATKEEECIRFAEYIKTL